MRKIRFATWYDSICSGRNDGNPLYITAALKRLEIYGKSIAGFPVDQRVVNQWASKEDKEAFSNAKKLLDEQGFYIEADHLMPYADLAVDLRYDYNVWVDWGEDGLGSILPKPLMDCPKPMIYWASDTHLGYDYRLSMAKKADIVFAAQKKAVEDFEKDGVLGATWLPHAVEPIAYPKSILLSKKYDMCFVGHVNSDNRIDALDAIFKAVPNFYYGQRRFEEAAKKYGESKIAFNVAMKDDINMRCFEVMATGTMLLTDRIYSIENLFENGKHLVLYDDHKDMAEKAKYYLANNEEREKIAEAGYEEVIKNHTINNRVMTILNEVIKKEKLCTSSVL